MTDLVGEVVRLRTPTEADVAELARIRAAPEVYAFWRGGTDLVAAVHEDLAESETTPYVIEVDGAVVGWIQWGAEDEPDYRSANMDIYLSAEVHGRGIGPDALRTLARHLFVDHGHHRIEIDPAAHNRGAIRAYEKVGFQRVGITRRSERGPDGTWHDGLLMDLLADEFLAGPASE